MTNGYLLIKSYSEQTHVRWVKQLYHQSDPWLLCARTGQVISVPSSVLCARNSISTTEHVVFWMRWIPSVSALSPRGLTCTLVHMNSLQREWIFQGWCKNAFRCRFLMWLTLQRDFCFLFFSGFLLWVYPSLLKRVVVVAPTAGFHHIYGRKIPFLPLLHRLMSLVAIGHRQTPTFLPTEACCLAPEEILSVCICLCPSSPTTSQSFVMHVRWSIYSLHLHCVVGMWHWSNFSRCLLTDTVRHRAVNLSNVV